VATSAGVADRVMTAWRDPRATAASTAEDGREMWGDALDDEPVSREVIRFVGG
jgi:hypothetical protein